MTANTIDRRRHHGVRKLAAVLAGLLILGIAATTTVAGWNGPAGQAAFSSQVGTAAGSSSGATAQPAERPRAS